MRPAAPTSLSGRERVALFVGFQALAFLVYAPALLGPPISDDFSFFFNPYVQNPSLANLAAILDPRSQATLSLINYAPVRPLLHALLWKLSPENTLLYHGLNVALHGVASLLVVPLLLELGLPFGAAVLGGVFFLVHPANVEAVAWMCQVWSPLALIFSLLALLWLEQRPARATLAFALALLTKPMAVFALPAAAALAWVRERRAAEAKTPSDKAQDSPRPSPWPWIAAWGGLCVLYAVAQIFAFLDSGQIQTAPLSPGTRFRFMAVLALRYLVMAATSFGVSAAQEPAIPGSFRDPLFLLALPVLLLLGLRLLRTLRDRRPEAVGWVFALAAFAPVSQVFPFLHPFADRYLYFILPGLLAAVLLPGAGALQRIRDPRRRRRCERAVFALAIALCALFAARSFGRARLWQSDDALFEDAARHFPDGICAHLLRARERGGLGDAEGEIRELRAAVERGQLFSTSSLGNPSLQRVRDDPRYRAFFLEVSAQGLELIAKKGRKTQLDLREAARWHELRGETPEALASVEEALALGGPLDATLRADDARLKQRLVSSGPLEPQGR